MDSNSLVESYKKQLSSLRSSKGLQERLMKSQNGKQITIQSHEDIQKVLNDNNPQAEGDGHPNQELAETPMEVKAKIIGKTPKDCMKNSIESYYIYGYGDGKMGEKVPEYYKEIFSIFNLNYDFENDSFVDFSNINSIFLEVPAERDIYKFCKKIMLCSKMEFEIPILSLLYIEKAMLKAGVLMNQINWRRFTFIALVIASKVILFSH